MWISPPLHHFPPHTRRSRPHSAPARELPRHRCQRVVAMSVAVSWSVLLRPAAAGCLQGHASRPSAGWRSPPALVSRSPRGFCTFEAKNAGGLKSTVASLPRFQRARNAHVCHCVLPVLKRSSSGWRSYWPELGFGLNHILGKNVQTPVCPGGNICMNGVNSGTYYDLPALHSPLWTESSDSDLSAANLLVSDMHITTVIIEICFDLRY